VLACVCWPACVVVDCVDCDGLLIDGCTFKDLVLEDSGTGSQQNSVLRQASAALVMVRSDTHYAKYDRTCIVLFVSPPNSCAITFFFLS
jgi:hypothetical protein